MSDVSVRHHLLPPLIVVLVVASACGSLGEPYLGSFPTTSVPSEVDETSGENTVDRTDPAVDAPVLALPPRPADYLPSLIVVGAPGLYVVDRTAVDGATRLEPSRRLLLEEADEETPEPTTTATTEPTFTSSSASTTTLEETGPAFSIAIDDLFGGIVAQTTTGEIVWYPGTGGGPRSVEIEEDRLIEVGYTAGTPEAITERAGRLRRTRLVDNESLAFAELDAGAELLDLSSAGSVVAVATTDTQCGSVRFYSGEGDELAIDPFEDLVCDRSARPTIGSVGMSPDGEALAYTIVTYREDGVELSTTLRAVELTSGAEIITAEVGGSGEVVSSVAFDGVTAVMVRRSSARSEVVMIDAQGTEIVPIEQIPVPRTVTFARLPLSDELG